MDEIRVVVAIDFGTTFSGFSFAHINGEIETHDRWKDDRGSRFEYKVPTILLYNKKWNVTSWGPEFAPYPGHKGKKKQTEPEERQILVQNFKMHLGTGPSNEKHPLPDGLDFEKATIHYLEKLKIEIENKMETRWSGIHFPQNIRFVVTVPTQWDPESVDTMRQCIFKAGITEPKYSRNLEFTCESEAAAIHCLYHDQHYDLNNGDLFMVIDCGGGTVDITTRKISCKNKRLSEMTEGIGAACGSTYVDQAFIRFLGKNLGISDNEMNAIQKEHSLEFYKLIQSVFCPWKYMFDHDENQFGTLYFDVETYGSFLKKYVKDKYEEMQDNEWVIPIDYTDLEAMFYEPVDKILDMIRHQLTACDQECKIIFLVGGFSESPYLQEAIENAFGGEKIEIVVPLNPIAAVSRGGVRYGLSLSNDRNSENLGIIASRVLRYTFGLGVLREWEEDDPEDKIVFLNYVRSFLVLARRGDKIDDEHEVINILAPIFPFQQYANTNIYYSKSKNPKWPDEEGVKCLKEFEPIEVPHFGYNRPIEVKTKFGPSEVKQTSRVLNTGEIYIRIVKSRPFEDVV